MLKLHGIKNTKTFVVKTVMINITESLLKFRTPLRSLIPRILQQYHHMWAYFYENM